jgi:hypothetical protein
VSKHHSAHPGALLDREANSGIAGSDVRIIACTGPTVDIRGIDNQQITNIPIVSRGAVAKTQHGEVIVIMHQYAYTGAGKTIHSSAQLEWYKNNINGKSIKVAGGPQCISTNDGYVHPINIGDGLPYINMRSYTDHEWDTLPHLVWTSNADWVPTVLDLDLDDDEQGFDALQELDHDPMTNLFDEFGAYRKRFIVQTSELLLDSMPTTPTLDDILYDCMTYQVSPREVTTRDPNYEALCPHFGFLDANIALSLIDCP